ncbi:MAG: methyl-accepting chemotaxis protein, partial [Cryomorphaceae bacterium]|nr:methyl-accepting chemotaxis protein [Cryomorphaceae bacterium]
AVFVGVATSVSECQLVSRSNLYFMSTLSPVARGRKSPLNIIAYITGALAIITLFLFIKVYIEDTRDRALASENENRRNQKAILRLLDDMGSFADGDLTVRAVVTEDITGAMADSINYTIEELHILVEGINKASTQVTEASGQAQNISSELLVAAQKQSENIEETTIAVLGIAESIGKVSKSAAESAKVAKQSLAAAEKGAVAVRESSVGMNEIRTHIQETAKRIKRLGENSQEIGEIVGLISDLTEMTNVLALNAAIQAAAAGDAGRGFTVVAQEVQRLAERSAEATKQISTLVKTTQGDTQEAIAAMEKSIFEVVEGGKLSDATGQALEEIEQVSNDLAQLIAGISNATHVQAQAADQVVKNMEE